MSVINLSAKLDRTDTSTPWGFRMHGGKDFFAPLSIQRVTPGSLAAKCGLLVGDVILKIGGMPTDNLRHKDAQQQILSSGNSLELALRRGGDAVAPPPPAASHMNASSVPQHSPQPSWNRPSPQPNVPQGNYNITPKPFGGGGGMHNAPQYNTPINLYSNTNAADSLAHQTAAMGISGGGHHSAAPISPPAPKPASSFTPSGGVWRPAVPTGPRTMKLGRAGEARSMPAAGGSDRIPMCHGCGVAIRGPFVMALDKTWCPDHFICANPQCKRSLIDVGFVEETGQLYCENDYEQYLAPRCGKCSAAIMGSRIEAMNQYFHPQCFNCSHCHQPIGGKTFHVEGDEFYCDKDWAVLFQTKCYGCQFPIEPGDKWVEALSQNWHSECFNCSTCQINLEGQAFYAKGGKPFCKKHAMGPRF